MTPTQELIRDHQIIEKVLDSLELKLKETSSTHEVPVEFLSELLAFSRAFIDKCHHGKEESCLFPCLEKRGIPKQGGPIGMMLQEHEMGRALVRYITETLERYKGGTAAAEEVFGACQRYVELLRQHIYKENNILFPMGDNVMITEDHRDNRECFEGKEDEIGHGEHQRLVSLAEKMSAEK